MTHFICRQCGTQYAEGAAPPAGCAVCLDDRQYVRWSGQEWTTLEELRQHHRVKVAEEGEGVTGIGMEPAFGINQRALLLQSPAGNVLWDCMALLDQTAVAAIRERGGLTAIAISHPHYYTTMVEWAEALGGVPIYIHEAERAWVRRPSRLVRFWSGMTETLNAEMTLVRCGGHYPGGQVLHWAKAAKGKGALFSGDIVMVAQDRRHFSFMYSFPNYVPLGPGAVKGVATALEPFAFEDVYGAWWGLIARGDAKRNLAFSVERYLKAIAE